MPRGSLNCQSACYNADKSFGVSNNFSSKVEQFEAFQRQVKWDRDGYINKSTRNHAWWRNFPLLLSAPSRQAPRFGLLSVCVILKKRLYIIQNELQQWKQSKIECKRCEGRLNRAFKWKAFHSFQRHSHENLWLVKVDFTRSDFRATRSFPHI